MMQVTGISYTGQFAAEFYTSVALMLNTHPLEELLLPRPKLPLTIKRRRITPSWQRLRTHSWETSWRGSIPSTITQLDATSTATSFLAMCHSSTELGAPSQVTFLFSKAQQDGLGALSTARLLATLRDEVVPAVKVVVGDGSTLTTLSLWHWYELVIPKLKRMHLSISFPMSIHDGEQSSSLPWFLSLTSRPRCQGSNALVSIGAIDWAGLLCRDL